MEEMHTIKKTTLYLLILQFLILKPEVSQINVRM